MEDIIGLLIIALIWSWFGRDALARAWLLKRHCLKLAQGAGFYFVDDFALDCFVAEVKMAKSDQDSEFTWERARVPGDYYATVGNLLRQMVIDNQETAGGSLQPITYDYLNDVKMRCGYHL